MQLVTRDVAEYAAALPPSSGTATMLVGTPDVAVPIAKILEFARVPGAPQELKEFAQALEEQLDFRLAAERRNEPEGASLEEMRKKYGL